MFDTARLLQLIDGSAVDVLTLVVGIVVMVVRPTRRLFTKRRPCFSRLTAMVDFMNGVVIVPFGLLVVASISKPMLEELIHTNRFFLAVAGVIGLIFVVGEVMNPDDKLHFTGNSGHDSKLPRN